MVQMAANPIAANSLFFGLRHFMVNRQPNIAKLPISRANIVWHYRMFSAASYVMFFCASEFGVVIARVIHGGRDASTPWPLE